MRRKMVAVGVTALVVVGVVAGVAQAVTYFKASVSPASNVKPGTTLTARGTGALKSTAYYCVISAYVDSAGGPTASDDATLKKVTSNSKGDITCKVKYEPFKAKDSKGATEGCPLSAAAKKAGWRCGVAFADAATVGARSESVAAFSPVK